MFVLLLQCIWSTNFGLPLVLWRNLFCRTHASYDHYSLWKGYQSRNWIRSSFLNALLNWKKNSFFGDQYYVGAWIFCARLNWISHGRILNHQLCNHRPNCSRVQRWEPPFIHPQLSSRYRETRLLKIQIQSDHCQPQRTQSRRWRPPRCKAHGHSHEQKMQSRRSWDPQNGLHWYCLCPRNCCSTFVSAASSG
jgi:hypothetical protein